MKSWFKVLLVVLLLAAVYRDSFTSRFFQDDAILMGLAKNSSVFSVVPNFPYRPVAIQLYYSLAGALFGSSPLGYHLILFVAIAMTIGLIYLIAGRLLASKEKGILAAFFYAFNISLFANFYWTAVSYFSLGALFFFATVYFYLAGRKLLMFLFFLLALGSNEIAIVLPVLLAMISWYQKKWQTPLVYLGVLDLILLAGRILLVGLPRDTAYTIVISSQVVSTIRWYLLRALNLPEGIRFAADPLILVLFCAFLVMLVLGKKPSWRLLVLGGVWFVVAAVPFFFLPNHMSSYYLTMAVFGPALLFAEVLSPKAAVVYFLLTVRGLDFLARTHWIILKNTGPIGQF